MRQTVFGSRTLAFLMGVAVSGWSATGADKPQQTSGTQTEVCAVV